MRSPVNTERFPINPNQLENNPLFDPMYHCTRVLVAFAQGIFKCFPKGQYHWDSDLETTEIVITDQTPLTSSVINTRPAIVITRGQFQFANLAIGNLENIDTASGNRIYRDMLSGSITYNCLARNGIEASRLSWVIGSHVKKLRVFLQQQGPFTEIGQNVMFLGESPPGAILNDPVDSGTINVPVVIPFHYPHRWEVRDPAFQLETIKATIKSDEGIVLAQTSVTNE